MSSIYRYPLKPPVDSGGIDSVEGPTEAIDYLVLKRSRIFYDEAKADGEVNIHHLTQQGVAGGGGKTVRREYQDGCVYLAMPPQLSTAYQAAYSQQDIGVMGLGLAQATEDNFKNVVDAIQQAAGAGLPEFAASTATNIANSFGNMLGLAGKMDQNALQQLNRGKVFNPFSEQIFKSMAFRQHQFNFKMLARSQKEAEEIQKIIDWIKIGATPKVEAGNSDLAKDIIGGSTLMEGYDQQNKKTIEVSKETEKLNTKLKDLGIASQNQRFFQIPDHFDLRFIRVDPAKQNQWYNPTGDTGGAAGYKGFSDGTGFQSMHFKIHPSFCNNVGVNYTPDGQYTSFKHVKNGNQIQVPVIQLSLQFIETRLVSQQNAMQGY